MTLDIQKEELAAQLRGSLFEFIKFFLKYTTNRDYIESRPTCRESHQITICRELVNVTRMKNPGENLMMNVEPGSGKTLHVCMWIAWCYTHYPDCNFIYVSYSQTLAASKTAIIKQIMGSDAYRYLFGVELSKDSRARDNFGTTAGGHVAAFGSEGAITGRDAGLPGLDRFSGCVLIDDAHKPSEAHSQTMREAVIRNYEETIRQRPRGKNVPIVFIGQRVHERDLAAFLMEGKDTKPWRKLILKSLDDAGNALYPEVHPKEYLLELQDKSPYIFASQFQQDPLPAGGGLFKPEWIEQMDFYPDILKTFITVDTAETDKTYNDATAFGFWGIYEIETFGRKTGLIGIHSIDCREIRVDPKDLEAEFLDFWQECCLFNVPPMLAAIEKKSTGVTLISTLKAIRGLSIRDIQRTRASGSKTERFLSMQPYLAQKLVSINSDARHKELFLTHLSKITANNTHAHDDIADILYDAIEMVYIGKQIKPDNFETKKDDSKVNAIKEKMVGLMNARRARHGDQWQ